MPIHAEDKARYPANWREVSESIKARAEYQCECSGECGLHPGKRCEERHQTDAKYAKGTVVLTVAHLDHTPENCSPENLKAFCQRCHLRYDQGHHETTRKRRRRESQEKAGQTSIFEVAGCKGEDGG